MPVTFSQTLRALDQSLRSPMADTIALKPVYAETQRNLANAKKFSSENEQFSQMQALYRDPAIFEKARCHICFRESL